ncbi:MAG: DUF2520 domain-containing protein [Candidatus Latescibacteria bacterium]|nr:DUF2520 domain-containing protein [Candidatus Latescibacterota bacterium]
MTSPKPSCQLIGAGRAGRAIASAMTLAGYRFTWIGSSKREDAELLAQLIGCSAYGVEFTGFEEHAEFLILSVPDDEIESVAQQAIDSGIITDQTIAAHLSGALDSIVLNPVCSAGASIMAFHPAQSFTVDSNPELVFKGICFDMEGDIRACSMGEKIACDLGAVSVILTPEQRLFTHLAMTITSNYSVTLIRMAEDIMKTAGVSEKTAGKMLFPLFTQTVRNIEVSGTVKALTGPVARGDINIIRKHLVSLKNLSTEYNVLYRSMARIAVQIAAERGDINTDIEKQIKRMLDD